MSEQADDATTFEIPVQITDDPRLGHHVYHREGGYLGTVVDVRRFTNGDEVLYVQYGRAVNPYNPATLTVC